MPTFAELIDWQREFEGQRGLLSQDMKSRFERGEEEWGEARAELELENWIDFLLEMADVSIFTAALVMRVIDHLGLPNDYFDKLIEKKLAHNHEKYCEDYFGIGGLHDALANMRRAKHTWNNGEPEGNDVY